MKLVKDEIQSKLSTGAIGPEAAVEEYVEKTSKPSSRFYARPYTARTLEQRRQQYMTDNQIRLKALSENIPFICRDFIKGFRLTQGLVLVGAVSGKSKSTTISNVIAGFLENSEKHVVLITNEETSEQAYNRIACIQTKVKFIDMQSRKLAPQDREMVVDQAKLLMEKVEIIAGDREYDMCCVDDVIGVLEHAAATNGGLIGIDYLQTVTYSKAHPEWEPFQVLKYFGEYLRDYGRRATVPVVTLCQLRTASEGSHMKDRVENDRTIYNHAFQCIEVIPDFETLTTTFKVHKDRFGEGAGKEAFMKFVGGRYEMEGEDSL